MRTELQQLLKDPKGCNVAVVGAGVSGMSAAALLQKLDARVTILDEKGSFPPLPKEDLLEFDFIVLSPGFPRAKPPIVAALAKGIPIVNEIDLACVHLPDCRFIGVTGTNGKSTTTAMIGEILKSRDPNAFVGGNFGKPLCDAVLNDEHPSLGVLELSSYQLETLSVLQLDVALVTHLTPDHLDRYKDARDYYLTKNRIFSLLKPQGLAVINGKDPVSAEFLTPSGQQVDFNVPLSFVMSKAVGAHNAENAAAALTATRAFDFSVDEIEKILSQFAGIPHRLEFLGEHQGVRWFNDSKATNVESSIVAVKSFEKGVHLILGGVGKGASYLPLAEACQSRVKRIYAIGEDAPTIDAAFSGLLPVECVGTLENAVRKAVENSSAGDVILLAPACASFDQYPNYGARGDHLKQLFHSHSGGIQDA